MGAPQGGAVLGAEGDGERRPADAPAGHAVERGPEGEQRQVNLIDRGQGRALAGERGVQGADDRGELPRGLLEVGVQLDGADGPVVSGGREAGDGQEA